MTPKLLIRCPECGLENYAPNVASGVCTWCGFDSNDNIETQPQPGDRVTVIGLKDFNGKEVEAFTVTVGRVKYRTFKREN